MTWFFYTPDGAQRVLPPEDPIPAGSVMAWADNSVGTPTAPTGWLLCDGSAVSRTTYALLFSAIGEDYGPGDGATTFNLPNVDTCFVVGSSSGFPTASRDVSLDRSQHNHGGGADQQHKHRFDSGHTHTMLDHRHRLNNHTHNSNHTHDDGTLTVNDNTSSETADSGLDRITADNDHAHGISGSSLGPNVQPILDPNNDHTGLAGGGPTDDTFWLNGTRDTTLSNVSVAQGSDILPPYLSVFFIIKAM